MSNAIIIFKQTVIMFLYMAVGFGMYRAKLVTKEGSASMASLLLYVIIPVVLVQSFQVEYTAEKARELLSSSLAAVVLLLAAMLISHLCFRKNPVNDFGTAFSNAGFMGFPLITALLGKEAIFSVAGFVALINVLQWTYGQYLLSGDKADLSLKKIYRSPILLAFLLGLLLFFTRIKLSPVLSGTMSGIAAMNAPLAMIVMGVYLAQLDVKAAVCNLQLYFASAVRLILIPLVSFVLLYFLLPGLTPTMKTALYIAAMAPVGSNVAVYAQKQGKDYSYAVGLVCMSTLLCILTMPLLIFLTSTEVVSLNWTRRG